MLTDQDLDDIDARLKCYDGEYTVVDENDPLKVIMYNKDQQPMPPMIQIMNGEAKFARDEYARLVAHAPEDIQNLLEEVKRLRSLLRKANLSIEGPFVN